MPKMLKKYARLLEQGEYDSIQELCNDLGLNYDDLYEDEKDDEDESPVFGAGRGRRPKPLFPDSTNKKGKK